MFILLENSAGTRQNFRFWKADSQRLSSEIHTTRKEKVEKKTRRTRATETCEMEFLMTESKICPLCHKEFFRNPEDKNRTWTSRKYCSYECYLKYRKMLLAKPRITRACEFCGKSYEARNYVTRTGMYQKYCCVECQHEAARKRNLEFKERDFESNGLC